MFSSATPRIAKSDGQSLCTMSSRYSDMWSLGALDSIVLQEDEKPASMRAQQTHGAIGLLGAY